MDLVLLDSSIAADGEARGTDWRTLASRGRHMPHKNVLKRSPSQSPFAGLTVMVVPCEPELIPAARMVWRLLCRGATHTYVYTDAVSCVAVLKEMPEDEAVEHLEALDIHPGTPIVNSDWIMHSIQHNRLCDLDIYRFGEEPHQASVSDDNATPDRRHASPLTSSNPFHNDVLGRQSLEDCRHYVSRIPPLNTYFAGSTLRVANPKEGSVNAGNLQEFEEGCRERMRACRARLEEDVSGQPDDKQDRGRRLKLYRQGGKKLKDSILEVAVAHDVMGGFWIIRDAFRPARLWLLLCEETVAGRLGCAVEMECTNNVEGRWSFYVYTKDFTDAEGVARVLGQLWKLGAASAADRLFYKPHAFRALDVHSRNDYHMTTSIYDSDEFREDQTAAL